MCNDQQVPEQREELIMEYLIKSVLEKAKGGPNHLKTELFLLLMMIVEE